jgi:hypothetical protein
MIKKFIKINKAASKNLEINFPNFFGVKRNYHQDLIHILLGHIKNKKPQYILEAGGIDRPLLKKSNEYKYVGLDIESKPACFKIYDDFIVQSIELPLNKKFDLIISSTLLEHVNNNTASTTVIFNSLNDGGSTIHYIPSKGHFYSIILRLVGPRIQRIVIDNLRPEARVVSGYPAFFDKCSPSEIKRLFFEAGFTEVNVITYYRATDYFSFFLPAFIFVAIFENIFEALGVQRFASGMIVNASK